MTRISDLIDTGPLATNVGDVLPRIEARVGHEMVAARPHKRGKIGLAIDDERLAVFRIKAIHLTDV